MTFDHTEVVTTSQIREAWSEVMAGRDPSAGYGGQSWAHNLEFRYRSPEPSEFIGASGAEILRRLEEGYWPEASEQQLDMGAVEITAPLVDLVEEDGDLLISQALGGEDLMYAQWQESEQVRGLTIRADIGMAAVTDAKVLGDYMTWLLQVVDAAERRGVAPDVELTVSIKRAFGVRCTGTMQVVIPLVKAGEIVDAVAWRAFLAPGAFRSLGFTAIAIAARRVRKTMQKGFGQPANTQWGVEYTDDVLTIECPPRADAFPAKQMDALLEAAYATA